MGHSFDMLTFDFLLKPPQPVTGLFFTIAVNGRKLVQRNLLVVAVVLVVSGTQCIYSFSAKFKTKNLHSYLKLRPSSKHLPLCAHSHKVVNLFLNCKIKRTMQWQYNEGRTMHITRQTLLHYKASCLIIVT